LGDNSKGYGDRTHPFKKAYSYGQKELAIPILSLNPTIKLNEEKPHKQRIMQKFDKPVKEYHKISEGRCVKMRTFFFYAQSPDFHKQGLCYYLKILYL